MDPITTASLVDYRQSQVRQLASSLRWERRRPPPDWARRVRIALGRRLVLAGIALLDGGRRAAATTR